MGEEASRKMTQQEGFVEGANGDDDDQTIAHIKSAVHRFFCVQCHCVGVAVKLCVHCVVRKRRVVIDGLMRKHEEVLENNPHMYDVLPDPDALCSKRKWENHMRRARHLLERHRRVGPVVPTSGM